MDRWMMLVAVALAAAPLAGCVDALDESRTTDDDGQNERRIIVDVPDDATAVRVDVTATRQAGEADVTLLIEDASGENLAEDTFSVGASATRSLEAAAAGHDRMVVVVRVVDGEAELDVKVYAVVPGQPEVVIVRETIVVRVETPPPATTTPPTPPPSTTTPPTASTPPATTTPPPATTPPTNATNATNGTNATG